MSSTTAANRVSGPGPAAASAPVPSAAVVTVNPPSRRPRATASRSTESSSTTSTAGLSTTSHAPRPLARTPQPFRRSSGDPATLGHMTNTNLDGTPPGRVLLNKVPEVTVFFWIIKILATTVGETAADFLSTNLGLGLGGTTLIMSVLFLI